MLSHGKRALIGYGYTQANGTLLSVPNTVDGDVKITISDVGGNLVSSGKNLFDKDSQAYNVSISGDGTKLWGLSTGGNRYSIKVPCLPNTTYTLTKIGGNRFNIFCHKTNFDPTQQITLDYEIAYLSASALSHTFTTPVDAHYICAYLQLDTSDLADVQLNLGDTATPYTPFAGTDTIAITSTEHIIKTYKGYTNVYATSGQTLSGNFRVKK